MATTSVIIEAQSVKPGRHAQVGDSWFRVVRVETHALYIGTYKVPRFLVSIYCEGLPVPLTVHKRTRVKVR